MKDRYLLFLVTMALLSLGVVMVYSASFAYAERRFNNPMFFLYRELLWTAVGLIMMTLCYRFNLKWLRAASPMLLMIAIVLVALTYGPMGIRIGGARRWLDLGFFTFQPSEIVKFTLMLYLASYLAGLKERVRNFGEGFLFPIVIIVVSVLMVAGQPDFGTAVMTGMAAALVLFVAGCRLKFLVASGLSTLPVLYYFVISAPYRLKRVLSYLDPWQDPQGAGFQIVQSFLAIARGRLTGVGLGESTQKLFYLPEAHTDFIFSILAEELGFLGGTCVIVLFMMLTALAFWVALREDDPFRHLLAVGCVSLISLQALFNVAVVTGMVPTKGIPLPFISFGGSNLVMNLCVIGILMNISRSRERERIAAARSGEATRVPWFNAGVRRRAYSRVPA